MVSEYTTIYTDDRGDEQPGRWGVNMTEAEWMLGMEKNLKDMCKYHIIHLSNVLMLQTFRYGYQINAVYFTMKGCSFCIFSVKELWLRILDGVRDKVWSNFTYLTSKMYQALSPLGRKVLYFVKVH